MVNKAILVGRLGRDPEVRYTNSGKAVANFSLATDERMGGGQSRTEWHNIVAWDRLAEICGQYLVKGKLVYIEGRLQTRDWDDRDGNKRRTTEVVANVMQMLDSRSESPAGASPRPSDGPSESKPEEQMEKMKVGITDDDIPF